VKQGEQAGSPLIAVVGPCAAGKSLLVEKLRRRGYNAREVMQEHSYVPAMWRRITNPDLLIYLDVSGEIALQRRSIYATPDRWEALAERLHHARQHADIYLNTDDLTPQEVFDKVLTLLEPAGSVGT